MITELWRRLKAYDLNNDGEKLLEEGGSLEQAEALFREAYNLMGEGFSNKKGRIASNLGYALLKQGRDGEAEPYLKQGVSMSDVGVRENMRYADFLMERGRYQEAKTSLRNVWLNDTNEAIDLRDEVQEKFRMCQERSREIINRAPSYEEEWRLAA